MKDSLFLKVEDVAELLEVSKPFAYKLIRELNQELKDKGYVTIAGRVSKQYFEEKIYGQTHLGA